MLHFSAGLGLQERSLKAVRECRVLREPGPQRAAHGHIDFPSISSNEWLCKLPGQAEAGCSRPARLSSLLLAAQSLEPPYGQHLLDTSSDPAHREPGAWSLLLVGSHAAMLTEDLHIVTHLPFYWCTLALFFIVLSHSY